MIAAIWLLALIMLALMFMPRNGAVPEFEITDKTGEWEAQGTVAVFDDTIYPGKSGQYDFVLHSLSEGNLKYVIVFDEYYTGDVVNWAPFMEYRLKMNGKCIETDEWRPIKDLTYEDIVILAETSQLMTLEWRWQFESGKDDSDTEFGFDAGTYSIVFHLRAEVIE